VIATLNQDQLRHNVSTLDLVLNCGPKARDIILAGTP